MSKINLIKNQIDEIICSNLIKSIFTTENIKNDNDCTIDLYFLIDEKQLKMIYKYINTIMTTDNNLLFDKSYKSVNYYKTSYFFENATNINVYYLYDLNIKLYQNIIIIHDPYNLLSSFSVSELPYTNIEFAKKIDEFSLLLFELYNSVLKNDRVLSYSISLKIQNQFILIYRGFYDSLNAKKENKQLQETMKKESFYYLTDRIKLLRFDSFFDAVRQYIKDIDLIIEKLPVNLIILFNIDFYNFSKKLIYTI